MGEGSNFPNFLNFPNFWGGGAAGKFDDTRSDDSRLTDSPTGCPAV
jgi:hypothetical protein